MTDIKTRRTPRRTSTRSPEQIEFDSAGEALARKWFGEEAGEAVIEFRGVGFRLIKLADPNRLGSPLRVYRGERDDVLAIVREMLA